MQKRNGFGLLLLLLCFLVIVAGCAKTEVDVQTEFAAILKASPTPETIQEAFSYLEEQGPNADPAVAGQMAEALEAYLITFLETASVDEITEQEREACAILLVQDETGTELTVDYTQFGSRLQQVIPEPLAALYTLQAIQQTKPMSENATLLISWEEVYHRAYLAEQLIRENPENEKIRKDAEWIYKTYVNVGLMGTSNSPIFDYETSNFNEDARIAAIKFIRQNPDAVLTKVLNEYFSYLESVDYQLDYRDQTTSKVFFDTCDSLLGEAQTLVLQ